MPISGTREVRTAGSNYSKDALAPLAKAYLDITNSILHENGLSMYEDTTKVHMNPITDSTIKDFFVENCFDRNDPMFRDDAEAQEDQIQMMEEMYINDKEAILEHSAGGQHNPVIGMTFPIHKNIMLNNIFDKGAIPKFVATSPKFTVSMETRWLIDPVTGEKIDMWKDQWKMTDAILKAAPLKSMYISLPEGGTTDVLATLFGATDPEDHLSIESFVSGIVGQRVVFPGQSIQIVTSTTSGSGVITYRIEDYTNNTEDAEVIKQGVVVNPGAGTPPYPAGTPLVGDFVVGAIFPFEGKFTPAYGEYDRQIVESFSVPMVTAVTGGEPGTWKLTAANGVQYDNCTSEDSIPAAARIKGFLSGFSKDDRFGLSSSNAAVGGIILTSRIDTSSAKLRTASVSWDVRTDIIEIPNAIPINVTISPEEVKDISALYQINQLTKVLSLIKTSLNNYKDDLIRRALDEDFVKLPNSQKIGRYFDFAPTTNYALDPLEWRYKMFMDAMDTHVTQLLHVLNDPNMSINVIGRDDLIRKITPTEYTYQTPTNIGPVELDFVKTVVTSDRRTYQFISSDKLRDTNNLIVLLCPRNTDRFIYRIYDFQMYLSNEIRNYNNPSLPAVHAFERWKFEKYQPVQGRIGILNPTGLRNYGQNYAFNNDPVGRGDGQGVASVGKNDFDIDAR